MTDQKQEVPDFKAWASYTIDRSVTMGSTAAFAQSLEAAYRLGVHHASSAPAAVIAFDASDSDHSDLPLDDWQKEAIKRHAARQAKKGEGE